MKIKDLRKRVLYVTACGELCRYEGKESCNGKVYYRFGVSSPHCLGDTGSCDKLGIYYEPVLFSAGSNFILGLRPYTSGMIKSCAYVALGPIDNELYVYDHGIRRALQ